jgi:hypothetical protein
LSQQVGLFISNLLKLNYRQQQNKKIKRKKSSQLTSSYGRHEFTEFASSSNFSMPDIFAQKSFNNFLSPKVEAIKRLPS